MGNPHFRRLVRFKWGTLRPVVFIWVVVVFGALGFSLIEKWTYFYSLYFTVMTMTTVGYGE